MSEPVNQPVNQPTCDARFGWAITRPEGVLLVDCAKPPAHFGSHSGPWNHNYPDTAGHTTITWEEDDRRTFRGEWARCAEDAANPFGHPTTCILPANHRGEEHFG
jgi:hypothetical protein